MESKERMVRGRYRLILLIVMIMASVMLFGCGQGGADGSAPGGSTGTRNRLLT